MGLADQFVQDAGGAASMPQGSLAAQFAADAQQASKPSPQPAQGESSAIGRLVKGAVDNGIFGVAPQLLTQQGRQVLGDRLAGAVRGAGSIGATLMWPIDKLQGTSNDARRQAIDQGLADLGANTASTDYTLGKLTGELAGTAGVGSGIAAGAKAIPAVANRVPGLISAIESGGFTTGANLPADAALKARALDLGIRAAGGAINGGASAGMIDPSQAAPGAFIGGILPPAIAGAGKLGNATGQFVSSMVQPFTNNGQTAIAGKVINRFAAGGPTAIDASQIVPGSMPTLAEATGNAGIASLQRTVRDMRAQPFVDREAANAAARNSLFDNTAGDADQLHFFQSDRTNATKPLYDAAIDPVNQQPLTPWMKGQITQLMKSPTIQDARKQAQLMAMDRLEKPSPDGSMSALQDMKFALDDKISEAVRQGSGKRAAALGDLQDKLVNVMNKINPQYGEANQLYAQMSQPINAMETLQGLKLRDAQGNITLAKVQNALQGLQAKMNMPGVNPAKSITADQIKALESIRDDLLRQSNVTLGKSFGSNTFQNLATDNMLQSTFGNGLGGWLSGKLGTPLGQVGKFFYSGANDAIKDKMVDMLLNPEAARAAFAPAQPGLVGQGMGLLGQTLDNPLLYRAAPLLPAERSSR
jgi:hypothetical protein